MAIDQNSKEFLAAYGSMGVKPFYQMEPKEGRDFMASLRPLIGEGPEMHEVKEFAIDSDGEKIKTRVMIPSENPRGVIVYYHGGGWVVMSIDDYDTLARNLAKETNCVVVLPDFRLAPEHPFPAAVVDSLQVLLWSIHNVEKIGCAADVPIITMGDSAGGNLAALTTIRAKKIDIKYVDAQVLIYPVTQPDTEGYVDKEERHLLLKEDMEYFWNLYAPNKKDRFSAAACPLLEEDLSLLPDTILITAAEDILMNEGYAYSEKLKKAGVNVTYKCFEGQIHGFFTLINILEKSTEGRKYITDQLDVLLAG